MKSCYLCICYQTIIQLWTRTSIFAASRSTITSIVNQRNSSVYDRILRPLLSIHRVLSITVCSHGIVKQILAFSFRSSETLVLLLALVEFILPIPSSNISEIQMPFYTLSIATFLAGNHPLFVSLHFAVT